MPPPDDLPAEGPAAPEPSVRAEAEALAARLPGGINEADALAAFTQAEFSLVLVDARAPDYPITYVNDAFERVTGYPRAEVVGRNCRLLQGPGTDPDHRRILREAITAGRGATVDILNYRRDGSPWRNRVLLVPIKDETGTPVSFIGVQKALTPEEARLSAAGTGAVREVEHRVKNHLAMILGLIRLQARDAKEAGPFDTLARRVESLQLLYEELSADGPSRPGDRIGLGSYLGGVARAVTALDGRPGIRLDLDMAPCLAPVEAAARVGLVLSEVVTNALEHAFVGRGTGAIRVRLAPRPGGGVRLVVADDGAGLAEGARWPDMGSTGGRIVAGLVEGLGAALVVESGPGGGTRVTLDLPPELTEP